MGIRVALYRDGKNYHFMGINQDDWDFSIDYQEFEDITTIESARKMIDDVINQINQVADFNEVSMNFYILHSSPVNHYGIDPKRYAPAELNVQALAYAKKKFAIFNKKVIQNRGFPVGDDMRKYKKGFADLNIWKLADGINKYRLYSMTLSIIPSNSFEGLKPLWKTFNGYESMRKRAVREEYQEWYEAI